MMEFREYSSGRWVMFCGGAFWTLAIPFAYIFMFGQLMQEPLGTAVFVSVAMALLLLGAVRFLTVGISGIRSNGKVHLVLTQNRLQIIVNSGKQRGRIHDFTYAEIKEFYFISNGTKWNKANGEYHIKEGSSGTINFSVDNMFYEASVYNALPAAKYILEHLQDPQIDRSKNELDRNGSYRPKD